MPCEYGTMEALFYFEIDFVYRGAPGGTNILGNHVNGLISNDIDKLGMKLVGWCRCTGPRG